MMKNNDHGDGDRKVEVFQHEVEIERWRKEYLGIRPEMPPPLQDPVSKETSPKSGRERRSEPRYSFMDSPKGAKIYAHMGPRAFPILNISIGGIAFHSDIAFEEGTKVLMSALGMIALEVEVLDCEMVEVDADMMEYKYLVRAQFGSMVNGYQVYVLSREMHQQGRNVELSQAPGQEF